MSSITVYNNATEEIRCIVRGPKDQWGVQCRPGESYIEGEGHQDTDYVNLDGPEPVIAPKGDYTLEALPLPCTVTIEGVEYQCTEQPVFEFNYPGVYKIEVDAGVRYLKKEFEIDYQP